LNININESFKSTYYIQVQANLIISIDDSYFVSSNNSIHVISCSSLDQSEAKMGKLLSKIFGNKEMRILMLGLDAAGKTSILNKNQLNVMRRFFTQEVEEILL